MAEVGLPASEASKFMDYHDSKGWVVGRAPMKDWKAAVRTWKGNYKPTNGNVPVSAASRLTQEEIANINR